MALLMHQYCHVGTEFTYQITRDFYASEPREHSLDLYERPPDGTILRANP